MTAAKLVYVNMIYPDDPAGQGEFERNLLSGLSKTDLGEHQLVVFSAKRIWWPQRELWGKVRVTYLPLWKGSPISYLINQAFLFFLLLLELGRVGSRSTLYCRYNAVLIAPLIVQYLVRCRFVFRTGPVSNALAAIGISKLSLWFGRMLFALNLRAADAVVVVTKTIQATIETQYPHCRGKVVVVPNGAALDQIGPPVPNRIRPANTLTMGFVGNPVPAHGLTTVLLAIGLPKIRTQAIRLRIAGDSPYVAALKQMVIESGIQDQVEWKGRIPHSEVPKFLAEVDVGIIPLSTSFIQSWGSSNLKIWEYLLADRAVIASRCEDLGFLEENQLGWLAPPDSPEEWADLIATLQLRDDLSLHGRGREYAIQECSFDRTVQAVISACLPALSLKPR